jgi:tetratricopeptide (TPR) repeat protein
MKKLLKNLLAAFLFVGILASCETTDPLIEEAQINIFTQNFDSAQATLDRSIAQNPTKGLPHYYKALAYAEEARTIQPPSDRKETYRNFRSSIKTSEELFAAQTEDVPTEAEETQDLIYNTWGFEHNMAIEYVNNDSLSATVSNPYDYSAYHLENAVIINPDSVLSWNILAQIYGLNEEYEPAIDALKKAMSLDDNPDSDDYRNLSVYYRQTNQPEKAVSTLEAGIEAYPDSVVLVQNLADAYMQTGQRDESIAIIEDLIETDPNNAQYRLALGTQLLQITSEMSETISVNYDQIYVLNTESNDLSAEQIKSKTDSLTRINENITEELDELTLQAEEQLLRASELRPEDAAVYNFLGINFQNKAAALFEKRNFTTNDELSMQYDEQAKAELNKALEYYKTATELDPDNTNYWETLSRVYLQLDMQEEAEEAMQKAGM